jgi:hypothetical protein
VKSWKLNSYILIVSALGQEVNFWEHGIHLQWRKLLARNPFGRYYAGKRRESALGCCAGKMEGWMPRKSGKVERK